MTAKSVSKQLLRFNTSNNPFAYIRNKDQSSFFIDQLASTPSADSSMLSVEGVELLRLISSFLIDECDNYDWSISCMLKLLACAQTGTDEAHSVLYYMFEPASDPCLFDFYKDLINKFGGENTPFYKRMVSCCESYLSNLDYSSIVGHLRQNDTPLQAEWTASDGTVCDIWFVPNKVKCPKSTYSYQDQSREVYASSLPMMLISLPIVLFSPENTQLINEHFQDCIKSKKAQPLTLKSYILSHQDEIVSIAEKLYQEKKSADISSDDLD